MTDIDPRMLFAIRSLHGLVVAGEGMETEEIVGLKMVLESIVIDWRDEHGGLQKHE